jgi:type VI secretion system secreted protein Hcp
MDINCFLKWDDVKGEATDDKHKGEIEVASWSFGVAQGATGSSTHGKASWAPLIAEVVSSVATTTLVAFCAEGKKGKKVVLTQCVAAAGGSHDQLKIELQGAIVQSYTMGGKGGSAGRTDTLTISYDQCKIEHTPLDKDGKKGAGSSVAFDVLLNKKI